MRIDSKLAATLTLAAIVALTTTLTRPTAQAFPEPAIVNPSWSIDFEFGTPDAVAVTDPTTGEISWYWYLPYKVINNSGDDQLFIPEFIIYEDAGRILRAGQGVPNNVYPAIDEQLNNPLLKDPIEVVGKLLKGPDFAKEGVAIWPAPDVDVDAISIFIGGLHGETQKAQNPRTGEEVLLRRVLMLDFTTRGNFKTPQQQPVELADQRDVMR